ncbi:MAG: hypothetical protein JNM12_15405 [Alphaproteobacteria bacterium]|nr:hypothetical protein [Alphaproteobacteria bacterium]
MSSKRPKLLLEKPDPQIKNRLYNGRNLIVWEGYVKVSSVQGWVDNPRIDIAKKKLKEKLGDRDLTQEEIFELMKTDEEVRLSELRDDILKNGLREPLTLSFDGKLLDGNRRFFAVKYALDGMKQDDPNRPGLEIVPAYILNENATSEDEENVLVEENFAPSLKIEWPDYVKARKVIEKKENGLKPEIIARQLNWPKSKVVDTIKIYDIINDFETFAMSPVDPNDEYGGGLGMTEQQAQSFVSKHYQYFNEAQKSFLAPLKEDIQFKIQFFKWLNEKKFSSFAEVRIAHKAWSDPHVKPIIMSPAPGAAKDAKATIDYKNRVTKNTGEAILKIEEFARFLKEMSAEEIKGLPQNSRDKLNEAMELIITLSEAANEE